MPIPTHRSAWNEQRVNLLHSLYGEIPELSFAVMSDRINEETGSHFSRNALISKSKREWLPPRMGDAPRRVGRKPNDQPKVTRQHKFRQSVFAEQPLHIPNMHLVAPVAALNIPMWDLKFDQCKFPVGDAEWRTHVIEGGLACGLPSMKAPYCSGCWNKATAPLAQPRK